MTHAYVCRELPRSAAQGLWQGCSSWLSRLRQTLALDDFETWRPRLARLLVFAAVSLAFYWAAWFSDRSLVASGHSSEYVDFEQSFPLADGWLLIAALTAAFTLWRRRPSAVVWLAVVGGASLYLCALDVLYDLEHGIYLKPRGSTELAINLATASLGIGVLRFGWRFRHKLLAAEEDPETRNWTL